MLVGKKLSLLSPPKNASGVLNQAIEPLVIDAFPADDAFWRVDWIGEVGYPDRYIRRTHPSVLVYLSKVVDPEFQDNPQSLLSPSSTAPAKAQQRVWVSIGTLVILKVGDIWHKQKYFCSPTYSQQVFANLKVGRESTDFIKAGLNPDDNGFLIPISEHPWHLNATKSYCLAVNLPDGRRLIIPCVELIRFYFGSSSSLLKQIFSNQVQRANLYSQDCYDQRTGLLTLKLGSNISGRSAADIGRMCRNPVAWRAASMVGVSMLKANSANEPVYVQSFFPFEGTTDLDVSGKWLSHQDAPNQTFLVYKINSCTHPFPFKALKYTVTASDEKPEFNKQSSSQPPQITGSSRDKKNQPLVEQDPSNQLQAKTKLTLQAERFPDLRHKPVWKERVLSLKEWIAKKAVSKKGAKAVESAGIGEGGSSARVRPIHIEALCEKNNLPKQPPPDFVRRILEDLLALGPVNIKLLTSSVEDSWTIPVGLMASEDGEIDDRLFIQAGQELTHNQRLRRACGLSVKDDSTEFGLMALEDIPEFTQMYPLSKGTPTVDEMLVELEVAFLKSAG